MAFFETERFPLRISAGASGGPEFQTAKSVQPNGFRVTNRQRQYALHRYTIAFPARTSAEFEELRSWFYVMGGAFEGFRFRMPDNYVATQSITSMSLVSGSIWQMQRDYKIGARTYSHPIYKPVAGASIFRTSGGITTDITGSSTIDYTKGQVTISGHSSGDTYAWSGMFDMPMAFADDSAEFNLIGTSGLLTEWPSLVIEEIREADFL